MELVKQLVDEVGTEEEKRKIYEQFTTLVYGEEKSEKAGKKNK